MHQIQHSFIEWGYSKPSFLIFLCIILGKRGFVLVWLGLKIKMLHLFEHS